MDGERRVTIRLTVALCWLPFAHLLGLLQRLTTNKSNTRILDIPHRYLGALYQSLARRWISGVPYVETYLSIITQAYQILRRSCSSRGVNSDVPPCIH